MDKRSLAHTDERVSYFYSVIFGYNCRVFVFVFFFVCVFLCDLTMTADHRRFYAFWHLIVRHIIQKV